MRYLQLIIAKVGVLVWIECTFAYSCKDGTPKRDKMCYVDYKTEEMWCDDSNLTQIPDPDTIQAYMNPAYSMRLFFNSTCLENLQSDLVPYTRLQVLNLDGNKMTRISAQPFRACTKLTTLILSHNQIAHIDDNAFNGLTELEVLSLSSNKLTRISATLFTELGNLKTLTLANNAIEVIETNAFSGLAKLESLDLSGNKIRRLDWGYETVFQNLGTLNLQGNLLQSFNGGELRVFTKLANLNLQDNNISCITGSENFKMRLLESVQMSGNQLASLNADWFRSVFKHGKEPDAATYVNGNLWNCDCSAYFYWHMLTSEIVTKKWRSALDVECRLPAKYQGRKLSRFKQSYFDVCESKEENKNCSAPPTIKPPTTKSSTTTTTTTTIVTTKSTTPKIVLPKITADKMVDNKKENMTIVASNDKAPTGTSPPRELWIVIMVVIGCLVMISILVAVKRLRCSVSRVKQDKDEEKQNPNFVQKNREDIIEQTTPNMPLNAQQNQSQQNHVYSDPESNPNNNCCPKRNRNDSGCYSNHEDEGLSFLSNLQDIQEGVLEQGDTVPKQHHVTQEGHGSPTQMNSFVKLESSHPVKIVMELPQGSCMHCGNINK